MKKVILSGGRLLGRLAMLILLVVGAAWETSGATSFIEGYSGFKPADTGVDTDGNTYVVGTQNGIGTMKKYDSSGALIFSRPLTNAVGAITPKRMKVAPGGKIYIMTQDSVYNANYESSLLGGKFTPTGSVALNGITYFPEMVNNQLVGTVYMCGMIGGRSIVIKAAADLSAETTRTTYGGISISIFGITITFPGFVTTADDLVVDDAGNVYVGGAMGAYAPGLVTADFGNFNLANGWLLTKYVANGNLGRIDSLSKVDQLESNPANVSSKSAWYSDKIDISGGGDNYAIIARGKIFLPETGEYTFYANTDDGSAFFVDGNSVYKDDTSHGPKEFSGKVTLSSGMHDAEFRYFNGGDGAVGQLNYSSPGDSNKVFLSSVKVTGQSAYVFKLDKGLTTMQSYFVPSMVPSSGGEYTRMAYAAGWIYAAGHWIGKVEGDGILLDKAEGTDIEIVRLDTNCRMSGRATVKGASDQIVHGLSADEDGYVYVTGSFGPGSVNLIGSNDRTKVRGQPDGRFKNISASQQSRFIAKLDGDMNFQWVNSPMTVPGTPPAFDTTALDTIVCWNPIVGRTFWAGSFVNGTLTLGEKDSLVAIPATGMQGFVAVIDPDGTYTERVDLTIVSQYGKSGSQVLPFGGPPDIPVTQAVIKDSQVVASVPKYIYRDLYNNELPNPSQATIEQQAQIRFSATGYSLDDGKITGTTEAYTFRVTQDTKLIFKWATEYALTINSDLTGTRGTTGGLTSDASGSPNPIVKKHWILKDELVAPQIDGSVVDMSSSTLAGLTRYIVTGYDAWGPPNTWASPSDYSTTFFSFPSIESRQQITQFAMRSPGGITYRWKRQNAVQMTTVSYPLSGLPLVHVTYNPPSALQPQQDGFGSGTFWYDEHTGVQVGTIQKRDLKQLKGWYNGDGAYFPSQGTTNDLSSFTINGQYYLGKIIKDMVSPARAIWDYGERIFVQTNFIGNPVKLDIATINDSGILGRMQTSTAPPDAEIIVENGPAGSTTKDMAVWDDGGKKLYPLRPGQLLVSWRTTDADATSRVFTRVYIQYPPLPHYRHVASTPVVNLDPDPTDSIAFKEIKYSENGATVLNSTGFNASQAGRSVLLFTETVRGRGTPVTTYRVRVVETKLYSQTLGAIQTATIGTKVTSSYDTAGLDTGYVFYPNARYNPYIYDRQNVKGPIIPVNQEYEQNIENKLIVVWYENRDKILWPYQAVRYAPQWPTPGNGLNRIVIASRFGSESVADDGTDQIISPAMTVGTNVIPAETTFNPARFQQAKIYNQPDRTKPGYNPNEEHGVMAPSLRYAAVSPRPLAAYALRDNDLNLTSRDSSYTSDPYVLVQYLDTYNNEYKMQVFNVVRKASNQNVGALNYYYDFELSMNAGEPVIPFYPLVQVIGAQPSPATYGRDGMPTVQKTFWKDHKGTGWAISGDGYFYNYFYYPLSTDFWWPPQDNKVPGDAVAWLPNQAGYTNEFFDADINGNAFDYNRNDMIPPSQQVKYNTKWPAITPVLKVGETLTFSGGEVRADSPTTQIINDQGQVQLIDTPGLPGVVAWAAGEVVYDSLNPVMDDQRIFDKYTVRLYQALEERTVTLTFDKFPIALAPAGGRSRVKGISYVFNELPASLQKRVYYDPIRGKLCMKGFLNDKDIADSTLTASPPAVYVLEPNIMTRAELDALVNLAPDNSDWTGAALALGKLCRNPNLLDRGNNGALDDTYYPGLGKADDDYRVGIEQKIMRDVNGIPIKTTNAYGIVTIKRYQSKASPMQALGPGLAMFTNPDFMDPLSRTPDISYVTVAENNSDSLGSSPVALHIIKVDKTQRYRGAIKTILSDNVFDENIVLRHTGDFGANADALVFEWWYRPEDGTDALTPERAASPNPWKVFADPSGKRGQGYYQITLKGNPSAPEALLADTWFYVRYRHVNDNVNGADWEVPQPTGASTLPYQWAGAGNSSPNDLNGDGLPDYQPQLAQGWVKRVLDAVNPYEARITSFDGDAPATYSSMIQQFGARFEGPVALNPDKNVIENVGLIELYETVFDRAKSLSVDLSTPVSTPAIANALQLAATRLLDFYVLEGNEAYSDAMNPTISYGSSTIDNGHFNSSVFAFENMVASLSEEELGLLRGLDSSKARPVYNRLFWNFTKGEGEAAYAVNYNITDVNNDGYINEKDAMILYPQGHGDAWGHFLTAMKYDYELLRHPYFNWVSRSEFYNLMDIVIPVDFLDERKFAQAAAIKAKVGTEVLNLTYRSKYVEDPTGQWQGYTDVNSYRSWGVEEWARRTGQGTYFDWVTANALLPAQHPNTNLTGIAKVDRTTVTDISLIAGNLKAVQQKMDEANAGLNPLGLSGNVVPFDLYPYFTITGGGVDGQTHFEQIFDRALGALQNASVIFENACQINNQIRQVANNTADFKKQVSEQDLAYRNQLIEIFGTPYDGTIGSGKPYPAGYQGPDTMLYMYADVRTVDDTTVPHITMDFSNNYVNATMGSSGTTIMNIPNSFRQQFAPDLADNSITNFFASSVNWTDFSNNPNVPLQNMNLPVMARGYTFQAPPDWGQRGSVGQLQSMINQMLQAEADLAIAIDDWDGTQSGLITSMQGILAQYDMDNAMRDRMQTRLNRDIGFMASAYSLRVAQKIADFIADATDSTAKDIADALSTHLPTVGLAVSPGTAAEPAGAVIKAAASTVNGIAKIASAALEAIADGLDMGREIEDMNAELDIDKMQRDYDLKMALAQIEQDLGSEKTKRVAIFKQIQVLRDLSDQYRAKLSEGVRLMNERNDFNKKTAAMAQQNRYHDMTFRVARNAALEKYRSAFDLAARYVYLAAKAYDYDTNLDPNDAGSPIALLADIVQQRSLGLLTTAADGSAAPSLGAEGLAKDLAWLKANYAVLKTQLGINNPQLETATFSLCEELFRANSGTISNVLSDPRFYRTNLWSVPEFRTYCRSFAPESAGPQPGLVIPFSTQIRSGKNLFGWPLGPGDGSYDPSLFATRVSAASVWFAGYRTDALARTPRVYLVPVGTDIMTVPNNRNMNVRLWQVLDQRIPVPLPSITSSLNDPTWKPLTDSLSAPFGETRQFSSFLAYGFAGDDAGTMPTMDSRLVGRSVWNTRWLLIIPGATLGADANASLQTFVGSLHDIKLVINTFAFSGN
ncbi:MAG: PA14 domain-containing protein [Verrucomicrobiota bacterium]